MTTAEHAADQRELFGWRHPEGQQERDERGASHAAGAEHAAGCS